MDKYKKVLARIAEDGRFTKNDVQGLLDELTSLISVLEGHRFDLSKFGDADLPDIDSLSSWKRFDELTEAFAAIEDAQEDIGDILAAIDELDSQLDTLRDNAEQWMDPDLEREERSYARDDLVSAAADLLETIDILHESGLLDQN